MSGNFSHQLDMMSWVNRTAAVKKPLVLRCWGGGGVHMTLTVLVGVALEEVFLEDVILNLKRGTPASISQLDGPGVRGRGREKAKTLI